MYSCYTITCIYQTRKVFKLLVMLLNWMTDFMGKTDVSLKGLMSLCSGCTLLKVSVAELLG